MQFNKKCDSIKKLIVIVFNPTTPLMIMITSAAHGKLVSDRTEALFYSRLRTDGSSITFIFKLIHTCLLTYYGLISYQKKL